MRWLGISKDIELESIALDLSQMDSADIAKMFVEKEKTVRLRLWRPVVLYGCTLTALTTLIGYMLS